MLNSWRKSEWPIFHVRHNSLDPNSYYRPGQAGNDFKPEVMPLPNEVIITKQTNSAFIGTDLESRLRAENYITLVIVGVSTNNSVESTVRMAGNLDFKTYLICDATFTFGRADWGGRRRTAEEVHDMSLANLNREYCTVIDTATALQMAEKSSIDRSKISNSSDLVKPCGASRIALPLSCKRRGEICLIDQRRIID